MTMELSGGSPPRVLPPGPRTRRARQCRLKASFSCVSPASHGEIVVMEEPSGRQEYVVAWRRDRRFSRAITRLSVYGDRQAAISNALSLSCGYVPATTPARNRPRDFQRSAVYRWENSLCESRQMTIEEMNDEASLICARFGVLAVTVSPGSQRLACGSYFVPSRGIVIAAGMGDSATLRHEVAHYLVWRMGIEEPSHGPAFTAVLVAVQSYLGACRPWQAATSAEKAGIDINKPLLDGLVSFGAAPQSRRAA